jgi:hypothetical protein
MCSPPSATTRHNGLALAGRLAPRQRFATTLDCADISFIADGTLDELPQPGQPGRARVSGVDLNKPRIRAALSAALALTAAPHGFTVTEFTAVNRQGPGDDRAGRPAGPAGTGVPAQAILAECRHWGLSRLSRGSGPCGVSNGHGTAH